MRNAVLGLIAGLLVACFWENLQYAEQVCPELVQQLSEEIAPATLESFTGTSFIAGDADNVSIFSVSGASRAFNGSTNGGSSFAISSAPWAGGTTPDRQAVARTSSTDVFVLEAGSTPSVINVRHSANNGATWSSPIDVSGELPDASLLASKTFLLASGNRILVVAAGASSHPESPGSWGITGAYSDDDGATWTPFGPHYRTRSIAVAQLYSAARVSPDGSVHIVAGGYDTGAGEASEYLYVVRSAAGSTLQQALAGSVAADDAELSELVFSSASASFSPKPFPPGGTGDTIDIVATGTGLSSGEISIPPLDGWSWRGGTIAWFTNRLTGRPAAIFRTDDGGSQRGMAVAEITNNLEIEIKTNLNTGGSLTGMNPTAAYMDEDNYIHVVGTDVFSANVVYAKFLLEEVEE